LPYKYFYVIVYLTSGAKRLTKQDDLCIESGNISKFIGGIKMKLKKIHVGLAVLLVVTFLMGCGNSKENDTKEDNSSTTSEYEVALIIDAVSGAIDDRSFTQGAWEGIEKFAEQYGKTAQYYRSTEDSTDGYLNAIQMAVDNGATAVVCPGYSYEAAIFQAQDKCPDVYFILLDGTPQNGDYTEYKTADNTYSVVFAEEQAGYLAGYAVVKDGETKLGFMGGMAVPAVVRFGYGFVQGAQAAAEEMGLNEGDIQMKFGYTGNFEATPENQTKAASWYEAGTDVIFSCGGLILNSVTAAAEADGSGKVIGVDVDQQGESETVITSAMKMLSDTVYNALDAKEKGRFPEVKMIV